MPSKFKELFEPVIFAVAATVTVLGAAQIYTDHKMQIMQVKKEIAEMKIKGKILTRNPDLIKEVPVPGSTKPAKK